jgi:hypothetical protein
MIRKAVAGDAAALADLAAATFPLACPPGSSPEDIRLHLKRTLSPDKFAEYLADSKIAILVIEQAAGLTDTPCSSTGSQRTPMCSAPWAHSRPSS